MPACTDTIFEYFMLSYFHFQSNSSFHNNLTEFFKRSSRDAFWPLATYRSNNFLHEFVEISKLKHFFINWSVIWYTISNKIANHAQSIIIILPIWSELFANSRSWLKMAWEYIHIYSCKRILNHRFMYLLQVSWKTKLSESSTEAEDAVLGGQLHLTAGTTTCPALRDTCQLNITLINDQVRPPERNWFHTPCERIEIWGH